MGSNFGDIRRTENDALIELASSKAVHLEPIASEDSLHSLVLPPGHKHELVDLERFRVRPDRKRETVELHTPEALAAYTNRHKVAETTTLYANFEHHSIVAVLNDSATEVPGWGDHRASLALRYTDAWMHWESQSGELLSQVKFAEHIEDGLAEIVDPPSADMYELAQTFEGNQRVTFKSANRLRDGRRVLQWEEEIDARAGQKGEVTIPAEFKLMVAPFEGSLAFEVRARLRYRMNDGRLQIGYTLVRPRDILKDAFENALQTIESATGLRAFMGTPPVRP